MNKDKVKKAMDILNQYHNPTSSVPGEKLPFGKAKRYLKAILENATYKETEEYREDVKNKSAIKKQEIATKREVVIPELKELFPDYSEDKISDLIKLSKNNNFDLLCRQANFEVGEWLSNFVSYLKNQNVLQSRIDQLFASWIISIVGNSYLKLWDVIIGKNDHQDIQTQIENCQWEQFIDFLSQASNILWLPFHRPNNIANKLNISKDEFIENSRAFCRDNNWSILFNSIWELINRWYILIPFFATSDNLILGCYFWRHKNCRVTTHYDDNDSYYVSAKIS